MEVSILGEMEMSNRTTFTSVILGFPGTEGEGSKGLRMTPSFWKRKAKSLNRFGEKNNELNLGHGPNLRCLWYI